MLPQHWKDDLIDAIIASYGNTGSYDELEARTWFPFSPDCLVPYYYQEFIERLFAAISYLRSQGISPGEVGRKLPHIGHFREELDQLLSYTGHGDVSIPDTHLSAVCLFLVEIFYSLWPQDPFSKYGHFGKLTEIEVGKIVQNTRWIEATPSQASQVGILNGSLTALMYALYGDIWPYAVGDTEGPYRTSSGEKLFIREYIDLAPGELWRETTTWDVKNVRVLSLYKKDTDLSLDFYQALTGNSNLVQSLSRFALEVNGEKVDNVQILELAQSLGELAVEQYRRFESLPLESMKKKFTETHCYMEKDFLALGGIDWHPTSSIYKSIAGKKLLDQIEYWRNEEGAREVLRQSLSKVA